MDREQLREVVDLTGELRDLVGECELTGRRTTFSRNGRPVAVIVSQDEYAALRETIDISNDASLRESIALGEEQVKRGAMLLVEDLLEIE